MIVCLDEVLCNRLVFNDGQNVRKHENFTYNENKQLKRIKTEYELLEHRNVCLKARTEHQTRLRRKGRNNIAWIKLFKEQINVKISR